MSKGRIVLLTALALVAVFVIAVAASGGGEKEGEREPVPATGVSLQGSAVVEEGQSITLKAALVPSDSTDRIAWSSADAGIAMVSEGRVTGIAPGSTTVTATAGSVSASCVVEVTKAPTAGEQNALKRAQSYLKWQYFSEKGLYDQLIYEKFTEEEARYAVDRCGADWQDQADKKAKSYLNTSRFSEEGLVRQLVQWEDFTEEQARLAVAKCEADWDEQAVLKAREMMESSYGYSRDGILYDLVNLYDFTEEQAARAIAEVWP